MRSTAHTVKWERSPDLNARTDVRIEKSEHLETKWCYIAGIVIWLQYAIQNKSMCVCVCEARDLSSGAAFTGEKVKFTDLRRQEDILFGQKKKKAWKSGKVTSFSTFWKSSKSHQRDRDRQKGKKAVRSGPVLCLYDKWTAGESGWYYLHSSAAHFMTQTRHSELRSGSRRSC